LRVGRFEESAQKYQQALELDPNHFNGLIGYARLCDRQNDYDRAVSLYRKAIAVDDSDGRAWNDLGLCHARHEKLDKSWQALQQAVQRAPQRTLYRNNIASVLLQLNRHEEAVEHLLAVHEPAVAYYNAAYLVHQRGDRQAARYYLAAALEQDPQCAPARQLLAQLEPARSTPAARAPGDTQASSARPAQRRVGDAQPTHATGLIAGHIDAGNVSPDHAQILQPRISWRMQSEGEEAPRPKRLPPLPEQEPRGRLAQMPDSGNALVVPDEEDRGNTPYLLPPVR
jgi:Tfp pilus assembly protein PilF